MPNPEVPRRSYRTGTSIHVAALLAVALVVAVLAARIHMVSGSGSSSERGEGLASPTPNTLDPPIGFAGVAKNGGQVELTWSAPAGADISGFTIHRDGSVLKFVSPSLSSYVDITVQPQHTYHYEIESVGPTGRSSRVSVAGVRTPTPPDVALAQIKGFYELAGQVVSHNSTHWYRGQLWRAYWAFFPVCTSWTACDVTTYGDGEREVTFRHSRSYYSGRLRLSLHVDCEPTPIDEIDTVRFKATGARFIKGIWTATNLRGTVRKEVPASRRCTHGHAVIEFDGTLFGP
jgi:hypothetical protein